MPTYRKMRDAKGKFYQPVAIMPFGNVFLIDRCKTATQAKDKAAEYEQDPANLSKVPEPIKA
jgi:hypothetical protein